jgi:filamentous hemagglutinin
MIKDGSDFIAGKDLNTGEKFNRWILFGCIVGPEATDTLLRNGKRVLKGMVKVDVDTVIDSATAARKGGESVVGHALQKHAGRNPDIWGKVKGGADQINQTALNHLNEIIDGAGDFTKVTNERGVSFLEKWLPDGRGVRLNMDGTFKGFIDQ